MDVTKFKDRLEIFAIIIGGIWAVYTFFIEKYILPRNEPAFLVANSHIEKSNMEDSMQSFKCTVDIKNTGENRIYILASPYTVTGYIVEPNLNISDTGYTAMLNAYKDANQDLPRFYMVDSTLIIQNGEVISSMSWLEPNEEIPVEFYTFIPKNLHFSELLFDVKFFEKRDTNGLKLTYAVSQCILHPTISFREKKFGKTRIKTLTNNDFDLHKIFFTETHSYCLF